VGRDLGERSDAPKRVLEAPRQGHRSVPAQREVGTWAHDTGIPRTGDAERAGLGARERVDTRLIGEERSPEPRVRHACAGYGPSVAVADRAREARSEALEND